VDWFLPIDIYCERTDASFWSEPINALSNAGFLVAAGYALARWRAAEPHGPGGRDWPALALIIVVGTIGVGSFLFHTFANRWSLLADVIPIQVFMLGMFGLMLMRLFGWPIWAAGLGVVGFIAAGLTAPRLAGLVSQMPGVGALAGYGVGWLAMVAMGAAAWRAADHGRAAVARNLLIASVVFALSLTFRTIDGPVCHTIPSGTHFLWHLLNALTLWLLLAAAIDLGRRATRDALSAASRSAPARSAR
jgi:hypothetical protein